MIFVQNQVENVLSVQYIVKQYQQCTIVKSILYKSIYILYSISTKIAIHFVICTFFFRPVWHIINIAIKCNGTLIIRNYFNIWTVRVYLIRKLIDVSLSLSYCNTGWNIENFHDSKIIYSSILNYSKCYTDVNVSIFFYIFSRSFIIIL